MLNHQTNKLTSLLASLIFFFFISKPAISHAEFEQDMEAKLALLMTTDLQYRDESKVPQPFSVGYHGSWLMITDPKLGYLLLVNKHQPVNQLVKPMIINDFTQRGSRTLAINPVTKDIAIPGEHTDSIALFVSNYETSLNHDNNLESLELSEIINYKTTINGELKNPYLAVFDHTGSVLLVSNRQSPTLTAFTYRTDNKLEYSQTINLPKSPQKKTTITAIISDPDNSSFLIALNEMDTQTGKDLSGIVLRIAFDKHNGSWSEPETVIKSQSLKRISGMTLTENTKEGRFLVIAASGTKSVSFYQKNGFEDKWKRMSIFTNSSPEFQPDTFDMVDSVVNISPEPGAPPHVCVSSNQYIHTFKWNKNETQWEQLTPYLIKHKGRSPRLTSLSVDPEDNSKIAIIGAATGTLFQLQLVTSPSASSIHSEVQYKFNFQEPAIGDNDYHVGHFPVKDDTSENDDPTLEPTGTIYWNGQLDCPFFWKRNEIFYNPSCGVSLSKAGNWNLSNDFPIQLKICNRYKLCSTFNIIIHVTPLDYGIRLMKWVLSVTGLTLVPLTAGLLLRKLYLKTQTNKDLNVGKKQTQQGDKDKKTPNRKKSSDQMNTDEVTPLTNNQCECHGIVPQILDFTDNQSINTNTRDPSASSRITLARPVTSTSKNKKYPTNDQSSSSNENTTEEKTPTLPKMTDKKEKEEKEENDKPGERSTNTTSSPKTDVEEEDEQEKTEADALMSNYDN